MPTPPPPVVPAADFRATINRIYTYSENQYGPYSFTRNQPTKLPRAPVWDMMWPQNKIAAVFLALTPTELATWQRPARRAKLPARTFFLGYNLHRYNWFFGKPENIRRTYP